MKLTNHNKKFVLNFGAIFFGLALCVGGFAVLQMGCLQENSIHLLLLSIALLISGASVTALSMQKFFRDEDD